MSSQVILDLPLKGGRARAKFYQVAADMFGLVLTDFTGKPVGKGKSLTALQAGRLKRDLDAAKSVDHVHSIVWAVLGYGPELTTPIASTYTHPGRKPF